MPAGHPRRRPRYIALVAASVDGRISLTATRVPDWTSAEDQDFFHASLARMDAVVVGRNTYRAAAEPLRKRTTFVLSRRPKTLTRRGRVTFVNPARVDLAGLLEGYRAVGVLGGGGVYQLMLEQGLLDEIFVTVEPLVFGRGKEMFVGGSRTGFLALRSVKRLNARGTLLLHYRVDSVGAGRPS